MQATEWRDMLLSEVIDLQRGHDLPGPERRPGNVPILGSFGITGWHDSARYDGPGVTIGRSGASIGTAAYTDLPYWPLNTALFVSSFKGNHPRWVYWLLHLIDFAGYNSGSAQPSLNRNFLKQIPVAVPPSDEQQRIAEVLGALDDLMDTNKRQIDRLRLLVAELYQQALTRGEPRVLSFLDVFNVEFGGAFKGSYFTNPGAGLPLIRIRDLKTAISDTWTTERLPNEVVVSAGDILFGMDAEFRASSWVGPQSLLNQRVCRVTAPGASNAFALEALKAPLAYIEGHKTGTTVIHLNKRDLEETKVLVPSDTAVAEFDSAAEPLRLWSVSLSAENEQLRRTRDELLPLLMSGAVRVRPEGVAA